MRNDIQQLKQTISAEHNTVSLPRVMEQQRMTMIELFRQIQPILSVVPPTAPAQHSQIQPPTVAAIAPIQQPIVPPAAPLQQVTTLESLNLEILIKILHFIRKNRITLSI